MSTVKQGLKMPNLKTTIILIIVFFAGMIVFWLFDKNNGWIIDNGVSGKICHYQNEVYSLESSDWKIRARELRAYNNYLKKLEKGE